MDNEKIYIVEWRCFNDRDTTREIITATSLAQLFEYYADLTNIVSFAFEDVTNASVEEIERRLMYRGKYSV